VTKTARRILGSLSTAGLIMAGSLPLMAADSSKSGKVDDAKKNVKKKLPKVEDKQGSKSCGGEKHDTKKK
jgi:hypothetical protein